MTLGKLERFWKTILQEFLLRAQFDSFEDAQQRITIWINYYNHRRPHQGIKGLCPADRYFEIQSELKRTLSKGIEENALELALRGRPRDPFYMVGRMNGQNVVIRAEKGKLRMLVDGEDIERDQAKELIYPLNHMEMRHDNKKETKGASEVQCGRETQSSPAGLDGSAERHPDLQGDESDLDAAGPLAESGDGGYAGGTGAEERGVHPAQQPGGEVAGKETRIPERWLREADGPARISAAEETTGIVNHAYQSHPSYDEEEQERFGGSSAKAGGNHHEGPFGLHHRHRRSGLAGGVEEDLLQMGKSGTRGNHDRVGAKASRSPQDSGA